MAATSLPACDEAEEGGCTEEIDGGAAGDGGCGEDVDGGAAGDCEAADDGLDLFITNTMLQGVVPSLGVSVRSRSGLSPLSSHARCEGPHDDSFQLTSSVGEGVKLSLLIIDSIIHGEEVRRLC